MFLGEHKGEFGRPLTCRRDARPGRPDRGEIGTAGLEDAEQANHHLKRALDGETNENIGSDPERPQMPREPIGSCVEFAIGEGGVLIDDGRRAGLYPDLRLDQLMQTRGVVKSFLAEAPGVEDLWFVRLASGA